MKLLITTLTFMFISSVSYSQVTFEPVVNWQDYPAYVRIGIEKSIKEKSCEGLERAEDKAYEFFKKNSQQSRWIDIVSFTMFHRKKLKCY